VTIDSEAEIRAFSLSHQSSPRLSRIFFAAEKIALARTGKIAALIGKPLVFPHVGTVIFGDYCHVESLKKPQLSSILTFFSPANTH